MIFNADTVEIIETPVEQGVIYGCYLDVTMRCNCKPFMGVALQALMVGDRTGYLLLR